VLDITNGQPTLNPIEALECDYLGAERNFVLTACGKGAAVIVWKYTEFSPDLELIDEIELD
jgi:hypothetical protein